MSETRTHYADVHCVPGSPFIENDKFYKSSTQFVPDIDNNCNRTASKAIERKVFSPLIRISKTNKGKGKPTQDMRRLMAAPGTPVPSNSPKPLQIHYSPSSEQIVPFESSWKQPKPKVRLSDISPCRRRPITLSPLVRMEEYAPKRRSPNINLQGKNKYTESPVIPSMQPKRTEEARTINLFSGNDIFA